MITVILNQFIPYLISAKPTLIKFDFGVFTNFCIKQVKSNLVNTNTEGGGAGQNVSVSMGCSY